MKTSAIYGLNVLEQLGNYDPTTRSLRTYQASLRLITGDTSTELCRTWPNAGMMRNGKLFRLKCLEQNICAKEYGLWPTLTRHDYRIGCKIERTARMRTISKRGLDLPSYLRLSGLGTGIINPAWAEEYMGYPTGWTALKPSEMP